MLYKNIMAFKPRTQGLAQSKHPNSSSTTEGDEGAVAEWWQHWVVTQCGDMGTLSWIQGAVSLQAVLSPLQSFGPLRCSLRAGAKRQRL